jgi:hypothetical protein
VLGLGLGLVLGLGLGLGFGFGLGLRLGLRLGLGLGLLSAIRGSSERIWVTGEPQSQSQPKVWSTKRQRDRGREKCCSIPLLRHYGVRVKFLHIEIRYL